MNPFFSIVIPYYNRAYCIRKAIQSCIDQTYADFEIILVDDCSKDNLIDALGSFKDPRIRVIRTPFNCGAAAARNLGINEAKGRFIAFLDSDDEWVPTKLEICAREIERIKNIEDALIYSKVIVVNLRSSKVVPKKGIEINENVMDYIISNNGFIQTSSIVIARKIALEILFDDKLPYHNDYLFCIRAERLSVKFHFIDAVNWIFK